MEPGSVIVISPAYEESGIAGGVFKQYPFMGTRNYLHDVGEARDLNYYFVDELPKSGLK